VRWFDDVGPTQLVRRSALRRLADAGGAVTPIRWGLIGASDIAATRMVPAMRRLGHEVVAVGSQTVGWAATYANDNGIPASGSIEDLVARDDIDAVYISSTNEHHRRHTELAAATGKHVLCEKPLALTEDDAEAMLEACSVAGVILGTNHHLPGSGTHRKIRDLARSGAVGRILGVRVFHAVLLPERLQGWRIGSQAGGGVALDITCHDASVINALLEAMPLEIVALSTKQGPWEAAADDALMSTMRYPGGALVQTHDAFTVAYAPTAFHVIGSDGAIFASDVMTQDPIGTIMLRDAQGAREIAVDDRRDLYEISVAGFAAAIAGETDAPVVTGLDGYRAAKVAIAVRAASEHGTPVSP
jgi:1,5-anhydro-D-fructose reductase (1,5-anhydro-D-mannitol-forming)